jgi:hypothetical protein
MEKIAWAIMFFTMIYDGCHSREHSSDSTLLRAVLMLIFLLGFFAN